MKIPAKIDYACKALVELSQSWELKKPLQVTVIAKKQNIPMNFLTHILIHLKETGLVESVRGNKGGYILSKPPQEISLKEIFEKMGTDTFITEKRKKLSNANIMDIIWDEIDEGMCASLRNLTLENICQRKNIRDKSFTFDI